jgi:hypothetical protein
MREKTKVTQIQFERLFCAPLRWSSPWISTNEPATQERSTQDSCAPVSCTQELRWIPSLIFSAGRPSLDLPNLQKARIRAILDLRTGVAPARKLCEHHSQAHDEHTGSRGTCAERSAISLRDGLDLGPEAIKRSDKINHCIRKSVSPEDAKKGGSRSDSHLQESAR